MLNIPKRDLHLYVSGEKLLGNKLIPILKEFDDINNAEISKELESGLFLDKGSLPYKTQRK